MRILVTGSTGFVGSQLCHQLYIDGYTVRAFHRTTSDLSVLQGLEIETAVGDVTEIDTLRDAMRDVDQVYHAAGQVSYWKDSSHMYETTVGGTKNVLRAAREMGVGRVVFTSSTASLGVPEEPPFKDMDDPICIDENHTWNYEPHLWTYGHAKYLAELAIAEQVALGQDIVIVNPALIYGPGDVHMVSGDMLVQMNRFKDQVPFYVDGGVNVIHVDDVVHGHLAAMEHGKPGERYILGGENVTLKELWTSIAALLGIKPPVRKIPTGLMRSAAGPVDLLARIFPLPFNGELLRFVGRYLYYNTDKAAQELNFHAEKSTFEALEGAYDFYRMVGVL